MKLRKYVWDHVSFLCVGGAGSTVERQTVRPQGWRERRGCGAKLPSGLSPAGAGHRGSAVASSVPPCGLP